MFLISNTDSYGSFYFLLRFLPSQEWMNVYWYACIIIYFQNRFLCSNKIQAKGVMKVAFCWCSFTICRCVFRFLKVNSVVWSLQNNLRQVCGGSSFFFRVEVQSLVTMTCLEFLDYNLPCDLVVYCCVLIHMLLTVLWTVYIIWHVAFMSGQKNNNVEPLCK